MDCENDLESVIKRLNEVCNIEPETRNSSAVVARNEVSQFDHRAEFLVSEMMSATSFDEAKWHAARALERERAEAARNLEKENTMLKEQLNLVLQRNGNLEAALACYIHEVQQLRAARYEYKNDLYDDQFTTKVEVIY